MHATKAGGPGRRWTALALVLLGCRPGGTGADAGIGVAGARCEVLVPPEVREAAALGEASLTQEQPCPHCGPLCALAASGDAGPGTIRASVAYECHAGLEPGTSIQQRLEAALEEGGILVPALGRAAAQRSVAPGMMQLVTWDDDTPCALVVTWVGPEPERALELARGALRACTPEALSGRATAGPIP